VIANHLFHRVKLLQYNIIANHSETANVLIFGVIFALLLVVKVTMKVTKTVGYFFQHVGILKITFTWNLKGFNQL
jgi:hypothetical protein